MINKEKATKLLSKLATQDEGVREIFDPFDAQLSELTAKLKETLAAKTLDEIRSGFDAVQQSIGSLTDSLKEVRTEITTREQKTQEAFSGREQEIAEGVHALVVESSSKQEAAKNILVSYQAQLENFKEILAMDRKTSGDTFSSIKQSLTSLETTFTQLVSTSLAPVQASVQMFETSSQKASTSFLEQLTTVAKTFENTRKDLLTRINNIGGGSMNRKITFNGVDYLTKYTDINYKNGSNVTITAASNNQTKMVDVTIAASGGGGGSGTVTSVDISGANGIGVSGNPITTSGTITLSLVNITPTTVNALTLAAATTGFTIAGGVTNNRTFTLQGNFTVAASMTLAGAGPGVTMTFPGTSDTVATLAASQNLTNKTTTTQTQGDNSTKLATTAYVDAAALGTDYKEACKYATTAALPAIVYNNGSSGVGATLTAVSFGAISIDGTTPSVGDRILIKNQASTLQNGIYTVTTVGTVAVLFVLTRATDFNEAADIDSGDTVFVSAGTALINTTWTYNGASNPTMGTDAITFVQIAGPGSLTGAIGTIVNGQGGVVSTGSKGFITIPYNCTINTWYVAADVSGSIQFDVKRSGTSIVGGGGNKPLLSSAISGNATVSGWTSTTITAGDILEWNVDSAATVTNVSLVLKVTKS